MSLQPIVLDTDKTTPIYELPLKIRQGDTGDELQVTLGKSFEKYTDLSAVDVELIAKTPDQRLIKQAVTDKSGNTFKVKFPDEMYTNVGVFRNMYFKIGDDSTSDIKLVVLQGIGSIKEAGSYIDDFETLIKEGQSYVLALKDFADTGNSTINNKVAELTGKMQSFVDKASKDLSAAKAAWNKFQNNSETSFTDAQDKRASDFNSQKAGFETDFNEQQTDFENRFKALLATLQDDYDNFKTLINKDIADFNTSLDSLDSQATGIENRYDAIKAQIDALKVPEIGGRNYVLNSNEKIAVTGTNIVGQMIHIWSLSPDIINITSGSTVTISYDMLVTNADTGKSYLGMSSPWTVLLSAITYKSGMNHISLTLKLPRPFVADEMLQMAVDNSKASYVVSNLKLEQGSMATDWTPAPEDVQTAIKNVLDEADYSTNAEVDSKISTGVGQAKKYAEQSIKDIIGAAPATLDTIAELADAVTENKDGVQAINDGITKKADKTDVTALQNTVQTMITSISQADYDKLVSAGTVNPKIMYVIPDA